MLKKAFAVNELRFLGSINQNLIVSRRALDLLIQLLVDSALSRFTFSATEAPVRHSGALMGLVSSYYNVGQFAAYKAEQILVNKIPPR
ncbi:MAG: hypothetical protein ACYC2R_03670 [Burkholderiales bacterium]